MSDLNEVLRVSDRGQLSASILMLMMRGAGYALLVCLAILFTVLIIAAVGRALPEDSRFTPDPINRSSIELPLTSSDSHRLT
ncbi:MAG: RC-LH1 core complex protein PufX [Pseudomonadota bacterium]